MDQTFQLDVGDSSDRQETQNLRPISTQVLFALC